MNKDIITYIHSLIPISILRDNNLTSLEKLLLIEIISLCRQKGYCWATNKYFSSINNVSRTTISKSINNIASCNYIKIEYDNKNLNNSKRKIRISEVLNLELNSIKENLNTSIKETFKQYNKNNNNKINNIYTEDEEGNEYWHGIKIENKKATSEEQDILKNMINEITNRTED